MPEQEPNIEEKLPASDKEASRKFLEEKLREAEKRDLRVQPVNLSQDGSVKDAQELLSSMKETARNDQEIMQPTLEDGPPLTHEKAVDEINKIIDVAPGNGEEETEFLLRNIQAG
jgi:hypothetical protein